MKISFKNIFLYSIALPLLGGACGGMMTSCTDVESELVEFVEDNKLDTPNDTVYSLMGIISKMQVVADRTVILGEIRGDLVSLTDHASIDLKALADFTADGTNQYNNVRDYYAIIQNCNYFIANADTLLKKRGEKVFIKEFAAIKAYRAWTYLQLAINYGTVPFFTEPLLTEKDADPTLHPKYDINQICDYFIEDLAPYVDTKYPDYGSIGSAVSSRMFFPVRVLLGDLCLWSGKYKAAAQYYHDYLTKLTDTHPLNHNYVEWTDYNFTHTRNTFSNRSQDITRMYMASDEYEGLMSELDDIFISTDDNLYFYQADVSNAYASLSKSQRYVLVYTDPTTQLPDTISPADTLQFDDPYLKGDLRLSGIYNKRNYGTNDESYNTYRMNNSKYSEDQDYVTLYTLPTIYLRYAEALNRAGFPESAFAVLKYGLNYYTKERYISPEELQAAGDLISFSEYTFTRENTVGIHSRGCGSADADTTYIIPQLPAKQDSILFVEEKILDEMALETSFEGQRFYDLMRISLHRSDPTLLAGKVAMRNGIKDEVLMSKLSDQKNWYLKME